MNLEQIRHEMFPVLEKMTYLNTAANGLVSKKAIKAAEEWLKEREYGGVHWLEWYNEMDKLRGEIAKLINAEPSEIGFVQNTTIGLNMIANSIQWGENSNIVTVDMEFPANRYIWQVVSRKYGVELRVIENVNGSLPIEKFEEAVDENTKLIAISWVQYLNGYTVNLEELSRIAKKHGALLVIDGIQGVGSLKLDVKKTNIDFLAVGGHKWLMGLHGSGFIYIKKELLRELDFPFAGWLGTKEPFNFDKVQYEPSDDARIFELGNPAFIGYRVLYESIKLINKIGIENIEKRNLQLAKYLLENKPEHVKVPGFLNTGEPKAPIINIEVKDVEQTYNRLLKSGIIIAKRGKGLRISPHFYNSEDDVDKLLSALKSK